MQNPKRTYTLFMQSHMQNNAKLRKPEHKS